MTDKEWHVEKNNKLNKKSISINHRGLMPKCFNCHKPFEFVKSDCKTYNFKAVHPKGICPFKYEAYHHSEIEVIGKLREHNEENQAKRLEKI